MALVAKKLRVHALGGHLFRPPGLFDPVAVGLATLVVVGVVLGLSHCV